MISSLKRNLTHSRFDLRLRVQGQGYIIRVKGRSRVTDLGSGFKVKGPELRVQGTKLTVYALRAQDVWCRV